MKLDAIKVTKILHILCVVDQIFILHRSDHKNNKTLMKISKCNGIIWSIKILLFCLFHLLLLICESDQPSEWDAKLLHTKFAVMFHRKVVGCCFVAVFSNDVCDNILSNTRLFTIISKYIVHYMIQLTALYSPEGLWSIYCLEKVMTVKHFHIAI